MYDVSKLLRHSNIRMTEKYPHLAPEHLQKAIAGRGFSAHEEQANSQAWFLFPHWIKI